MNKLLQAELWEIQAILYLLTGHFIGGWIGTALTIWAAITFIGVWVKAWKYGKENPND